jgi:DnaA family protein
VIAVDDCDQLDDTRQLALFRLFNQRGGPGNAPIVTASRHAPIALTELRPELRTRLGSGLVLALRPLTDQEREQALREAARATGVYAHNDVFHYLLTRKARDLRTLLAFFSALDHYALERQRPLSAALAREFDALIDTPVEPPAAPRPIAGSGEPG